jgi:hypothetical protein
VKEGYGGRAGTHQFDEKVIVGVRTEDVEKKLAELSERLEELLNDEN